MASNAEPQNGEPNASKAETTDPIISEQETKNKKELADIENEYRQFAEQTEKWDKQVGYINISKEINESEDILGKNEQEKKNNNEIMQAQEREMAERKAMFQAKAKGIIEFTKIYKKILTTELNAYQKEDPNRNISVQLDDELNPEELAEAIEKMDQISKAFIARTN